MRPTPSSADLQLLVEYRENRFEYILSSRDPSLGLTFLYFSSRPLLADPMAFFEGIFHEIDHLSTRTEEDRVAAAGQMEAIGLELSEQLLPSELQEQLWEVRGAAGTLEILSKEPWVPWEVLRLGPRDKSEGRFLCELFSVTRWIQGRRHVFQFPSHDLAVVVPRDCELRHVEVEKSFLLSLKDSEHRVHPVEATYRGVTQGLQSGLYDGWHFAGHCVARGRQPDRWGLVLEEGRLLPGRELLRFAAKLRATTPLVFLNACSSARRGALLTGLGGMALQFLQAGAGGVLAAHWEVADCEAVVFAETFYRSLLSGVSLEEAVRCSRLHLRERFPGSPSWLAYAAFAHPLATIHPPDLPIPGERKPRKARQRRIHEAEIPAQNLRRGAAIEVLAPPPPQPQAPVDPVPGEERLHEQDGTVLLYVPGGELTLGTEGIQSSARPLHQVRLTPFWIARFPVTNEQYARFLAENPVSPRPAFWEDPRFNPPRHPVVGVSWEEAATYCRWAGLELPSEAQWEAAARGMDQRPYPWGGEPPSPRYANFGCAAGATTPVEAYPAGRGPYGTLDQAGNVWEWCADPWDSQAYQHREDGEWDPTGSGNPEVRTLRGGSWKNPAGDLLATCRERGTAKLRLNDQGFRCIWRRT